MENQVSHTTAPAVTSDTPDSDTSPLRTSALIRVEIEPIPDLPTDSQEWDQWCLERGFNALNGGRRAWCSSISTYLRDATGLVYHDGELADLWTDELPNRKCPRCGGAIDADSQAVFCVQPTPSPWGGPEPVEHGRGCGWGIKFEDAAKAFTVAADPLTLSAALGCSPEQAKVLSDIVTERRRQDNKYGPIRDMSLLMWVAVLLEELGEVAEEHAELLLSALIAALVAAVGRAGQAVHETFGERTDARRHGRKAIRDELIQVAAVAENIVEHMDRSDA